jgi:hypothetical protein
MLCPLQRIACELTGTAIGLCGERTPLVSMAASGSSSAEPTMSSSKRGSRGSNYAIDVVKLNLEASRRVKATLKRGPTHAGQFAYAGTKYDRSLADVFNCACHTALALPPQLQRLCFTLAAFIQKCYLCTLDSP